MKWHTASSASRTITSWISIPAPTLPSTTPARTSSKNGRKSSTRWNMRCLTDGPAASRSPRSSRFPPIRPLTSRSGST
ncbi:hypothetical protein C8261_00105 [Pseudothauera lacus]|uniref:Uncharacterized protein n=1 Tax=Pseudothauera lacus TaxID=2136175 RepID=A0A2T4IJB9_9RHOO|nr:hypothetical protein C8261_00105 [Pseudothauera lacus]